jgi:periplasmic divalent cation tolerance protein
MDAPRVVLITAPDAVVAERLARELVEQQLAACVNWVGGVSSVYRWQGRIEHSSEVLLIVKTLASRLGELQAWLEHSHPYDVPECIALTPAEISPRYLEWLQQETVRGASL